MTPAIVGDYDYSEGFMLMENAAVMSQLRINKLETYVEELKAGFEQIESELPDRK